VKNASPRDSLGLLTIKEIDERSKGFCYPKLEALLECFVAPNGQHLPLSWRESAKISKQKLAGNAVKCTKQLKNFMLVKTEIFTIKI
jgi:hypothetical protein